MEEDSAKRKKKRDISSKKERNLQQSLEFASNQKLKHES